MRFRKLRITWSLGCVIACVFVGVLWVRSYRWHESVAGRYLWPAYVAVPLEQYRPYNSDPDLIYYWPSPIDRRALRHWATWNAVSRRGHLTLVLHEPTPRDGPKDRIEAMVYSSLEFWAFTDWDQSRDGFAGFGYRSLENYRSCGLGITVPHWFSVVALGAFAAAPWIPWSRRFNLRTLLVATTLVAVALGLVIYTARKKPQIEKMPTQIEKTPDTFDGPTTKRRY